MSSNKNQNASGLFRKCEIDDEKKLHLPIPTQVVSNEEHLPIPQTAAQKRVEHELTGLAEKTSKQLGISRRRFLAASGGMAAAFLAMKERIRSGGEVRNGKSKRFAVFRFPKICKSVSATNL